MKRKKPKNGDVFEIQISDGMFSYGQLIEGNIVGYYIFYDIISKEHLPLHQVVSSPILLLAFTVNEKIISGEWKVIGNTTVPKTVSIPEFKVDYIENGSIMCMVMRYDGTILRAANDDEKKKLNTLKSYTPNIIENALKMRFGYLPWNSSYNHLIKKNEMNSDKV